MFTLLFRLALEAGASAAAGPQPQALVDEAFFNADRDSVYMAADADPIYLRADRDPVYFEVS
jgi:hypothetical protein